MSRGNIPSGFIKASLQNGLGRYVCQLKRLTISFCKERQDSQGARDFMEKRLVDFCRDNGSVAVYAQVKRHKAPFLTGEYLNGQTQSIPIAKKDMAEIDEWLDFLRTRSGEDLYRIRKKQHTYYPSTQGTWTPLTHKPMVSPESSYPHPELGKAHEFRRSTTDLLLDMVKKAKSEKS